ncbi:MAG: 3-octaprenyl-4-hydroxybenzoate carboxy-lyase [Alphaproteobacteria bacterium]|nr:3-octaprenyl-4-hydroxybenzoate carboxy-lyase [Alphaproteobacteria bacterium]|tara:strand:+ start:1047 stop:1661 length:615 start_codon:yes stop_codon:yes gene_type:complete
MSSQKRLIVGVSGASGVVYGVRLLQVLQPTDIETHLIISQSAEVTLAYETAYKVAEIQALADVSHSVRDIGAATASGSFSSIGMIVAPCSVRSMSEIATGVTSNLLTRSADVTLKERRPLVLLIRETPLHTGHLRTMVNLSEFGATVMPPVPAFYTQPESIDDIVDHTVGRALDLFGIDAGVVRRWGESHDNDATPLRVVRRRK